MPGNCPQVQLASDIVGILILPRPGAQWAPCRDHADERLRKSASGQVGMRTWHSARHWSALRLSYSASMCCLRPLSIICQFAAECSASSALPLLSWLNSTWVPLPDPRSS